MENLINKGIEFIKSYFENDSQNCDNEEDSETCRHRQHEGKHLVSGVSCQYVEIGLANGDKHANDKWNEGNYRNFTGAREVCADVSAYSLHGHLRAQRKQSETDYQHTGSYHEGEKNVIWQRTDREWKEKNDKCYG